MKLVDTIVDTFGLPKKPRTEPVPAALVREWMESNDLEVLGAVEAYTSDPSYARRIVPPLPPDEHYRFMLRYLQRCIRGGRHPGMHRQRRARASLRRSGRRVFFRDWKDEPALERAHRDALLWSQDG